MLRMRLPSQAHYRAPMLSRNIYKVTSPRFVTGELQTHMNYHRTITSYRELPPRMRIIYPEGYGKDPVDQYLERLDETLGHADRYAQADPADLVSLVFANRASQHELTSRQAASLIHERAQLAQRHLADIQRRLDELAERRPLRRAYGAVGFRDRIEAELERQILDLEKQRRDVQITLWRDTLDLRKDLVTERGEYQATRRRMDFLGGGTNAQP